MLSKISPASSLKNRLSPSFDNLKLPCVPLAPESSSQISVLPPAGTVTPFSGLFFKCFSLSDKYKPSSRTS